MGKVKVVGVWASPYSMRVEIALKMKGVEYEFVEEDLKNKSDLLIHKYNPIYKKIPVLVLDEKVIAESLVILEYIDEAWKGNNQILPTNSYDRAQARFWAKFIDDKLTPQLVITAFMTNGEESEKALQELAEFIKVIENEIKGKKFFGGDKIGYLDIVASILAYWIPCWQDVSGKVVLSSDNYQCFCTWANKLLQSDVIKPHLPNKEKLHAFYLGHLCLSKIND